jgi:hypothetical protein
LAIHCIATGSTRGLVILAPLGQPTAETLAEVRPQLTAEEAAEVALALGLDPQRP